LIANFTPTTYDAAFMETFMDWHLVYRTADEVRALASGVPRTAVAALEQFCDENQQPTRHPLAPTWPETMLTTVVLDAEDENRTRVTVTWEVFGEASAAECDTFHNAKGGMTQGWTGSFDKLDQYMMQERMAELSQRLANQNAAAARAMDDSTADGLS